MIDRGVRSIEVHVVNNTNADLIVQPKLAANNAFISGEEAKQGEVLSQWQDVVWGVMTDSDEVSVVGHVMLTGLGSTPIIVSFQNLANGDSSVTVVGNEKVTTEGAPVEVISSEDDHTMWQVNLVCARPAFPAKAARR